MEFFMLLIVGHLLADNFLHPTNENEKPFKVLALHIGLHSLIYTMLLGIYILFYPSFIELKVFLAIILIVFLHYGIDYAVWRFKIKTTKVISLISIFILSQLLHLLIIIIILSGFGFINLDFKDWLVLIYEFLFEETEFTRAGKILGVSILVLLNTYYVSNLMQIILRDIKPSNKVVDERTEERSIFDISDGEVLEERKRLNTISHHKFIETPVGIGKYIGILERLIIMVLVVKSSVASISFLVLAKSLTRYKQFDDKSFAEYYLIGTLISALFGIVLGYLILRIL